MADFSNVSQRNSITLLFLQLFHYFISTVCRTRSSSFLFSFLLCFLLSFPYLLSSHPFSSVWVSLISFHVILFLLSVFCSPFCFFFSLLFSLLFLLFFFSFSLFFFQKRLWREQISVWNIMRWKVSMSSWLSWPTFFFPPLCEYAVHWADSLACSADIAIVDHRNLKCRLISHCELHDLIIIIIIMLRLNQIIPNITYSVLFRITLNGSFNQPH